MAWGGIVAPAGTPAPVIERLNAAIAQALKTPEMERTNATMALRPLASTPENFARFIQQETGKWAELVRLSGAKAQ
ncbi:tripartite tricarboxylate transporter substrate-binding protein [Cupriavidus gilardii]|uniref:tripartite tricarboxylate transporter substrate-binding protein n=1 Tax=Cupriavidus gilardii TaxID=82541 RepID=UPI001E2A2FC4|nr:tripartite tricarboxylate transporter substrate-binding protein [Cupriavidus gilardii]